MTQLALHWKCRLTAQSPLEEDYSYVLTRFNGFRAISPDF